MMAVICARHQCGACATFWHDGQITAAGRKRVKDFVIQANAKQLLDRVASSRSPHERSDMREK
jgi:hypothetical protein